MALSILFTIGTFHVEWRKIHCGKSVLCSAGISRSDRPLRGIPASLSTCHLWRDRLPTGPASLERWRSFSSFTCLLSSFLRHPGFHGIHPCWLLWQWEWIRSLLLRPSSFSGRHHPRRCMGILQPVDGYAIVQCVHRPFGLRLLIVPGETFDPHNTSMISSTRFKETPARYISISASSTEHSRRRYLSMIAVSNRIPLSFWASGHAELHHRKSW